MTFIQSIISVYYNYFTFKGRATRSEYWWSSLFYQISMVLLLAIDVALKTGFYLTGLFYVMSIIPFTSVMVRRFHDVNRSGWWFWIILVPIFGVFYFFYLLLKKSTPNENIYGEYNDYRAKWLLISHIIWAVLYSVGLVMIASNPVNYLNFIY